MQKFKTSIRYGSLLIGIMLTAFILQKLLTVTQFPSYDFAFMPVIPLFFIVIGIISIAILQAKTNASVMVLLVIKTTKILLTLVFILLYLFFENENINAFLFSLLGYFMLYLLFETRMLSTLNKKTEQ